MAKEGERKDERGPGRTRGGGGHEGPIARQTQTKLLTDVTVQVGTRLPYKPLTLPDNWLLKGSFTKT